MRDMSVTSLCPVCREALWENLLLSPNARAARISLFHAVRLLIRAPAAASTASAGAAVAGRTAQLFVSTAALGRWRESAPRSSGDLRPPSGASVDGGTASASTRAVRWAGERLRAWLAPMGAESAERVLPTRELLPSAWRTFEGMAPLAELLEGGCWRLTLRLR